MEHQILNQNGKHIQGGSNLEKIKDMLHNGLETITIEGKEITVIWDYRKDGERVTTLNVEGI